MMIKSYGISRIGLVRSTNEDCIYIDDGPLYILADGMGGYKGGQIASSTAVQAAAESLHSAGKNPVSEVLLKEAIQCANRAILARKRQCSELARMGTTMIIAAISGSVLFWGHVGDSRLYVYENKQFRQITRDHSFVMSLLSKGQITSDEMRCHPRKNEITRAVGVLPSVQIDTGQIVLKENGTILICSDGLSSIVSDEDMQAVLAVYEQDPARCTEILLGKAYEAGAADNVSAIVVHYQSENKK